MGKPLRLREDKGLAHGPTARDGTIRAATKVSPRLPLKIMGCAGQLP